MTVPAHITDHRAALRQCPLPVSRSSAAARFQGTQQGFDGPPSSPNHAITKFRTRFFYSGFSSYSSPAPATAPNKTHCNPQHYPAG